MNTSSIIAAIEAHAARFGLKPSTIGQMAIQNRHIHNKLKNGSDIQIGTARRLLDWISEDAARRVGVQPSVTAEGSAQDGLHKKAGAA